MVEEPEGRAGEGESVCERERKLARKRERVVVEEMYSSAHFLSPLLSLFHRRHLFLSNSFALGIELRYTCTHHSLTRFTRILSRFGFSIDDNYSLTGNLVSVIVIVITINNNNNHHHLSFRSHLCYTKKMVVLLLLTGQ